MTERRDDHPDELHDEPRVFTPMSMAELRRAVTELLTNLTAREFAALMDSAEGEPEESFCPECGWLWPDGQERCAGCNYPDPIP